jgi:predicted MFS family arabinose efflux permease
MHLIQITQISNFGTSLGIGLFGLVGIFGVLMGPLGGRVLDRLVPWYGSLISELVFLLVLCIQLGAGGINIGAVVVVAFGIDLFNQMIQVSVTSRILGCVSINCLVFGGKISNSSIEFLQMLDLV